jgi:galactokinase
VDGRYGGRRTACETAAERLGVARLADITLDGLDEALGRLADEELQRVLRHVVTETDRVVQVAALLRQGRLGDTGPAAARLARLDARRLPDLGPGAGPGGQQRRSRRARWGRG